MTTASSHQVYEKEILPLVRNQKIVIPKSKLALVENTNKNLLITRFVSHTKNTYITVRLLSLTQKAEILCHDLESGNNVTIRLQVISPKKVLQVFPGERDEVKFPIKFKMPKFDSSTELDKVICDHIVNQVDRVIWISGAAGCGKSVLADRIIECLNSGEFNAVSGYKEAYAIKLSAQDYDASSARLLKKNISNKIDCEYRKFEDDRRECIDDGKCGFIVIFDEIDFVVDTDRMSTIFEVAMEKLGLKVSVVIFVDLLSFDVRARRSKHVMEIMAEKLVGGNVEFSEGSAKDLLDVPEFIVPDSLSNEQFDFILDEFPLCDEAKKEIKDIVVMKCKGHPLLSMSLLRKVLVSSYLGYDIDLDGYLNDMGVAISYILIEKVIRKANSVFLSSPRPSRDHIELLRRIARRKNRCTNERNTDVIELLKSLDIIEDCASYGIRIKSPIIKRFLRDNRMIY